MNALSDLLYHISTALLVPDVLGLFALLAAALYFFGGFLGEGFRRRGWRKRRFESLDLAKREGRVPPGTVFPPLVERYLTAAGASADDPIRLDRAADVIEIEVNHRLAVLGFGTRIGPVLGLLGTLIPLGPGLIALGKGDMETLAASLVVAFATTVVGLVGGSFCAAMELFRKRWYAEDLSDIDFLRLDGSRRSGDA